MLGLDPKGAYELKEMMREHAAAGRSVLFSTHVLETADKLCDAVCIIAHGRKLFDGTLENFWAKLPQLDAQFEEERKKLADEKMHWRFIAKYENGKGSVALCKVNERHPFYHLEGSNNIILLTTERYKEYPMLIQGYGAGASVTAAGVFADIMRIANI
jgi:ABC-type multidrug transport system ATPase subunit